MPILLVAMIFLTGCSTVEKTAYNLAYRVCSMEAAEREHLRLRLDASTHPHVVRVDCDK